MKWYKEKAKEILTERMEHYSKVTGWNYSKLSITNAQTRWGSCSHKNRINFSLRLIIMPLPVIDYVVVHELAHIVEKNHSRAFWDLVASMIPDHKHKRKELQRYARMSSL